MRVAKKPVGRPEKTDSDGNPVLTKVINVNVPIKLVQFLKDSGINRSELFSKVAASLYAKEICDVCYTKLEGTMVGLNCPACATKYWERTKGLKTFWKAFNDCPNCGESYSHENLYLPSKEGLHGCHKCGIKPKEKALKLINDLADKVGLGGDDGDL